MKKFYAILLVGMAALSVNAQTLQFKVNGADVAAGSKVDITDTFSFDDITYSYMFNPKLQITGDQAGAISATVTFTKGECTPALDADWYYGADIKVSWCAFDGQCKFISLGDSFTKNASLTAGTSENMDLEFVGQIGDEQNTDEQKISGECVIKCNYGGKDYELTLTVNKGSGAGVDGILFDENQPAEYFDLQGRRVANPSKGLYIVRQGNKVMKKIIK